MPVLYPNSRLSDIDYSYNVCFAYNKIYAGGQFLWADSVDCIWARRLS